MPIDHISVKIALTLKAYLAVTYALNLNIETFNKNLKLPLIYLQMNRKNKQKQYKELIIFITLQMFKMTMFRTEVNEFFRTLISDTVSTREKENIYRPDMLQNLIDARKKSGGNFVC